MAWKLLSICFALVLLCSCKSEKTAQVQDLMPHAIDDHECASCGMLVREQPAPRGQLVHRDGERLFFCSVSDMVTYLEAPSPHGAVLESFVETLDSGDDPMLPAIAPRPWEKSKNAQFVVGVDKPGVMGRPVLVYPSAEQASAIATKHSGTQADWQKLKDSAQR